MDDLAPRKRASDGRWLKGAGSPNPKGRPPRSVEKEYLDVVLGEVSKEKWADVVRIALKQALEGDRFAREFIAKYTVGEPTAIHEYLMERNESITIRVVFDRPDGQPMLEAETPLEGDYEFLEAEDAEPGE